MFSGKLTSENKTILEMKIPALRKQAKNKEKRLKIKEMQGEFKQETEQLI